MSTHTTISYHIVFSTKNRTPLLKRELRNASSKNRHSHLYRITFEEEFRKLLLEAGVEFDPRYLF